MARSLQLWQDARGYLHPSEASADQADRLFAETSEREGRRAIARRLLVELIDRHQGRTLLAAHVAGQEAADWIIANWPAIAAIGHGFRLQELAAPVESRPSEEAA